MATVNLLLKTKKNPASIYVRFSAGKNIDLITTCGICINPQFWDKKNQKIRNVIDVPDRDKINTKLASLKIAVVNDFNVAFMEGDVIDANWLNSSIRAFFNRPKGETKTEIDTTKIYLTDYAADWIKNKAPKYKVSADKYMDSRTCKHYEILNNLIIKFQGKNKIAFKNITSDVLDGFSTFLTEKEGYAEKTAKRMMVRFKFFCNRAEEENIEVNQNFRQRVFVAKTDKSYKEPYLTEEEIDRIFKHDFSYDNTLDNVRDNFVIGLRSGLRISDFLTRLRIDNIEDGFIEIKTMKTRTYVSIPVHPQVAKILEKRNGQLPKKISEQKFNDYIKIIGQIVEIDEEMEGGIVMVDEETKKKRKVVGTYPKYKLLTSHSCRRSFATNLFGKVPNSVLLSVCGWSSEQMLLKYVKKTNRDNAKVLQKFWNETT